MAEVKNNNFYDMGAMSYKENISKKIAEFTRENLYIGIPALVVGTDDYESLQCVDVTPSIDDVYTRQDSTLLTQQTLGKVFVNLPSTGGFAIKQPITKGDIVTLYWAHKDLGEWLDSDGTESVSQSVFKIANIEDCWVEPRGGTRKKHTNPSLDNLVIEGPETTITITPSGEISVVTSGTSTITSSGHTVNADTTINGSLTVSDDITGQSNITASGTSTGSTVVAQTSLTVAGTEMNQHVHSDVTEGDDNSGPPV